MPSYHRCMTCQYEHTTASCCASNNNQHAMPHVWRPKKRALTMPHEPILFKNLRTNELLADLCAQVSRALQVRATKNRHWRIQIHTLVRACVVNIFEVLQGTLRRAHAVATTMGEPRVLAEHLVSESLHVLLSHHEVYQGHQAEKQERDNV